MKSFSFLFGKTKKNKLARFTTPLIAALALAGGINSAYANNIKTSTATEITSASVPVEPTKPSVVQYQAAGVDPFVLIPVVLVGGLVIFVPLFFGGLVVIG